MSNLKLVLELDDESEIEITLEQAEVLYKELKTLFGEKIVNTSPMYIPPYNPPTFPWSENIKYYSSMPADITSFDPLTYSNSVSITMSDDSEGTVTLKAVT